MRKLLIVLLCMCCLFGCTSNDVTKAISVNASFFENDYLGIKIVVEYDFNQLDFSKEDVKKYGILKSEKEINRLSFKINNIDLVKEEFDSLENSEIIKIIAVDNEENYTDLIYVRGYIIKNDDAVYYSDIIISCSLYNVAQKSDSSIAKEIVKKIEDNEKSISSINISLDLSSKNYLIVVNGQNYQADFIDDPTKNFVIIIVTLNVGYYFADTVELIVDNVLIEAKRYTIIDNTLTYKFSDPNWSNIY